MITPSKQVPKSTITVPDRLVVFTFFSCGALASALGLLQIPALIPSRLYFSAFLIVILVFSFSALGWLLHPLCFFAFGLYMEQSILSWYSSRHLSFWSDSQFFVFGCLFIPAFFITGFRGLSLSAALLTSMNHPGLFARSVFQKDLLHIILFSLFGFSVVFYFF